MHASVPELQKRTISTEGTASITICIDTHKHIRERVSARATGERVNKRARMGHRQLKRAHIHTRRLCTEIQHQHQRHKQHCAPNIHSTPKCKRYICVSASACSLAPQYAFLPSSLTLTSAQRIKELHTLYVYVSEAPLCNAVPAGRQVLTWKPSARQRERKTGSEREPGQGCSR
jgi:hypothetical protein